ncbi:MAG TPA: sugar kinase [Oceanithermus sp.]|nr:sugar kinase [Oceanithermus sp.]
MLLAIGDYAWDVLVRPQGPLRPGEDLPGEVRLAPGGGAANVAVWARRLGAESAFLGKVGDDFFGRLAEEELRAEGVRPFLVRDRARATAAVAVWVDAAGERTQIYSYGADYFLAPGELPEAAFRDAAHLFVSGWALFTDPPRSAVLEAARRVRPVSLDPASARRIQEVGPAAYLELVRELAPAWFFPNRAEAQALTGRSDPEAAARALAERLPETRVVVKLDAEGALVPSGGCFVHLPAPPVPVVDATGAGDAFAGVFLAGILAGRTPIEAARAAVQVASWVVGRLGARPRGDWPRAF